MTLRDGEAEAMLDAELTVMGDIANRVTAEDWTDDERYVWKRLPRLLAEVHAADELRRENEKLRAALLNVIGSSAEFDDARIGYVTLQVDRGDLGHARALLASPVPAAGTAPKEPLGCPTPGACSCLDPALVALQRLSEAATPGPWELRDYAYLHEDDRRFIVAMEYYVRMRLSLASRPSPASRPGDRTESSEGGERSGR